MMRIVMGRILRIKMGVILMRTLRVERRTRNPKAKGRGAG